MTLSDISNNIKVCKRCRLCETALNAVPGEGNPNASLVFIGEAPGRYEDESGRPFVGRAGALLTKALEKIGYSRSDVWIGNVIKHRPPKNRDPLPDEIKACSPFLAHQLRIIRPKVVVTLGRFAMNFFYPAGKISRDHGTLIKLDSYVVYPVYHPAAALRNGNMMKAFLKDFLRIPEVLEEADDILSNASNNIAGSSDLTSIEDEDQLSLF